MRRPLLMMRTRGLTGPFFGRHVGNRASHPLAHSAGNFISIEDDEPFGPELIVNGSFAADTDWIKNDGWTIAGGVAVGVPGFTSTLEQDAGLIPGRTYQIIFTIVTRTAGSVSSRAGGTQADNSHFAPGTYTDIIVCGGTSVMDFRKGNTFDGTIDDVSCKEVL